MRLSVSTVTDNCTKSMEKVFLTIYFKNCKSRLLCPRSYSVLNSIHLVSAYSHHRSFDRRQFCKLPSLDKEATTTLKIQSTPQPALSKSWVESSAIPDKLRPYLYLARVDKPVGTMLLFWPCCWGVALATPLGSLPDFLLMGKFLAGAFIMRGAGCTINDLWDQDFDKKVERTKSRPLASGTLTTLDALKFLALQLSAGLAVLLTFNMTSIIAGFASMPLVIIYPLMKRYTNWPQLVLGLTFNWGCWVGYTAVQDFVNYQHILPLYFSGVCWTLVYDTIYGYQDRDDDRKIGVKSVPLTLGDHPQWPLSIISTGMLGGMVLTGYQMEYTSPFYLATSAIYSHMLWQIWSADLSNSANLWQRFTSNIYIGGAVTAAMISGHFYFF
jgi:4-hydroxybenzoate polyprenyltransferase